MKKSLLAFGITFLVSSALVHSQSNSEDCRKKDQLKKQVLALVSQEQEVIDKGKKEKAECDNEANPSKREKCMEKNVNPLRDKLKQIRSEREGLKPDVERFDALCPDAGLKDTKEMFEKIAKENCNPKGNQDRCEDGLFQLADLGYKDDARTNMGNQARYEREYEKWNEADRKGKEPRLTPPSYDLSVKTHKEYLAQMKTGRRRDLILYRLAFIYDLIGTPEQAFPLMMELVKNFPNSKHRGPANLRIGEYYFVQRNYDSAITYYNRVETKDGPAVEDNVLGLALYHKAEALYQKGRYDEGINAFFDYVDRADKGQIRRADLRQEAILYMGSSFAEFEDSYQKATAFFKKVGGRTYEDTLLFEMGKKHEDRDQFDRCILTYEQFLKRYPYFAKAPLAQIGLIQVYVKQKKIEEAQVERDKLVKNYVKGAPWWDKVAKMDPKDKETVSIAVRDAMLESAVSDHFPGKERNDTVRVRRSVDGYKRFMDAYKAEGGWPVYRANIYLADAQSWLGHHVEAADIYEWAAKQDVSKYGIPTRGEQNITQPSDAGYNAVVELTQAADQEITKAGGDKKKAYQSPVAQRYMKSVNDYITRFPKAPEVNNLSYNLVVYQYGGEDFTNAIVSAERLVKMFPDYKFMRETRRMLAQSYIEAGRFTDGEKEYRTVLSSTPANDSSYQDMTDAVAVSIFKQGEKAEKEGKIEEAVAQFRRVKKDMPKSQIADESAYRAGIVYEKAKMYAKAAKEFNDFSVANPSSKFTIEAVQRSAVNSVDGKDTATAIATYLSITDRFPKDSTGFNAIAIAASLYDSSRKDIQKAQTLEKYLAKYPEDTRTPGFLYTAGLTYEKAKDYQNAIRVYQIVFTKYPTNQYSPEAAFSIPIIQEKLGNKLEMAKAYEEFAAKYVNDKSKVAKAYLRAAMVYHEQKNMVKANELFLKVTKFYVEKDNNVAIDASIPAQAFFYMGEIEADKANAIAIGGTTDVKKIAEQIKARKEALKLAAAHYNNAIKLQIEEWALKSAIAMADQQFKVATDVADIKPPQGENLKAIQERIIFSVTLAKTTPKLSSDAAEMYAALIKLANAANVSNKITKEAGRRLLRTYLMQGQAMEGIGNAIASEPCPSKQAQGSDAYMEECEFHKAQKEDNQINFQKKAVEIGYAKGIEVAKEYQVIGPEYDTLRARVKFIAPEDPSLQVVVEEKKVEPKKFVDADFQRNMSRIAEIASSGMEAEERVRLLKSMKIEGERLEQELRTEVESLRAQITQAPKGK